MKDREELDLPLEQYLATEFPEPDQDRVWAKICARRGLRAGAEPQARPTLPVPVAETLIGQGELTVARARIWRGVLARVKRRQPRPRLARPFLAFATFVGGVALALLVVKHPESFRRAEPAQALQRADGSALGPMDASEQAQIVRFSDASEIRLARGARLEPLQSSSSRFEVLLARGSAEFAVTPGGPRRWLVEAGAARVEVVGTVFRVERSSDSVVVSVSRGAVLVRGENVPGWVQKVSAGQRVEVEAHEGPQASQTAVEGAGAADPAAADPAAAEQSAAEPLSEEPIAQAEGEPVREPHRERAVRARKSGRALPNASGSPQERYAALGPRGIARETASATSIETLLQLADIARLSGHPQEAVAPLTRALEAFRSSPQAALAAFTLGRVQLDQLDLARPAAGAFERAIALRLPRALLPDCYRRLAEAYGRAGDAEASARAGERLRALFAGSEPSPESAANPGRGTAARGSDKPASAPASANGHDAKEVGEAQP
jgi:transmembrane sensor